MVSDEESFVFLTMHKAGSSIATEIIRGLFRDSGWRLYDFETEAFDAGLNEAAFIAQKLALFETKGAFFGPFRAQSVSLVPQKPSLKKIIHTRDPRDCLVSYYYSLCYSHKPPGTGPDRVQFEKDREFYQRRSVDAFCLEMLSASVASFKSLRKAVESSANAVISRYEDMVRDFSAWLKGLLNALPVLADAKKIESLNLKDQFSVPEENMYSHKRQVTPGDFRRKLKPETQDIITKSFSDDLMYFSYK